MTKLNIKVGKTYPASYILDEINNHSSGSIIQIGHAVIRVKSIDKHLYYIDKKELEELKKLNDTKLKVLSIINPCEQNFAFKLIMSEDTQENLKEVKLQKDIYYAVDMYDLMQFGYRFKSLKCAVNCMNCVFKKNEMPFKATNYSEGKIDKKHYVKISYKAG